MHAGVSDPRRTPELPEKGRSGGLTPPPRVPRSRAETCATSAERRRSDAPPTFTSLGNVETCLLLCSCRLQIYHLQIYRLQIYRARRQRQRRRTHPHQAPLRNRL